MISKDIFPTYAQYNEDITLLALLFDVEKGFYVDVGANYPVVDSVTKLFYDRGWRGVNIEPIPSLHKQLVENRPDDINLMMGIGDKPGELEFFENTAIPGHSSFSRANAEQSNADDIRTYKVEVQTLAKVLDTNGVGSIHFLKIDVEGLEEAVIRGNNWLKYRPFVICIESNHRKTTWQKMLVDKDYKLFVSDGLNEYYVATEQWSRTDNFAERAVSLSYRALKQHQYDGWKEDSRYIVQLEKTNKALGKQVDHLAGQNQELMRLSLSNQSFGKRLLRSGYGLTIDWIRYRKKR